MFRWYKRAAKCYAYLTDVSMPMGVLGSQDGYWETDLVLVAEAVESIAQSLWFTKGWINQIVTT